MSRGISAVLGLVLVGGWALGGTAYAETKMTIAWGNSENTPYGIGAAEFKRLIEGSTSGAISVQLLCCLQMGNDEEMLEKMTLGVLDAAVVGVNNTSQYYDGYEVFHLPYVLQSAEHAIAVLEGAIGKEVNAGLKEATGNELLGYFDISFRNTYNTKRPINTPADLAAMKYRVPQVPLMIDTMAALGAEPIPMGWGDHLTGMQTGVIEGGDTATAYIFSEGLYQMAPNVSLTEHLPFLAAMIVSRRFMEGLDADMQDAVRKAAADAAFVARAASQRLESEAIEKLEAAGIVVLRPEKEAFVDAVQPVWQAYVEKKGEAATKMLERIQAEVR